MSPKAFILSLLLLSFSTASLATVWQVGPSRQYTKPTQVMPLVQNGDTVEIDAGTYAKDVGAWNADSLLLRCSSGYAHLDAQGTAAQHKAIWIINGKHNRIEGIEFSGCAISEADGSNGAGIRLQSTSLEVRRCYFHDNQEGILTGNDTTTEITVEASEFDHNGVETGGNAGFQHNIYVGHSRRCTIRFCYFHNSIVGHEIKCRANTSYILYNRIVDGATGDGSYSIDLPNGGLAFVIGNSIEKGPATANSTVIEYCGEGIVNRDSDLYFVNNTIVANRKPTTFFFLQTGAHAHIWNNLLVGGTRLMNGVADTSSNLILADTSTLGFTDARNYDYRLTQSFAGATSTIDPETSHGFSMRPTMSYVHPLDSAARNDDPLTIGAFPLQQEKRVSYRQRSTLGCYPHPFRESARLTLPGEQSGSCTLRIEDELGRVIETRSLTIDHSELAIHRGTLATGVYHFVVRGAHQAQFTGSFVVAP
jgi:hypothetical protein